MMKKIYFLLGICILITGCGHWEYPGSQADANRLSYDCRYLANMSARGRGYWGPAMAEAEFHDCMVSRGFVWVKDKKTGSANRPSDIENSGASGHLGEKKIKEEVVNFGVVDIRSVVTKSKYLQNYFLKCAGNDEQKGVKVFFEIKRFADTYCEKNNFEFLRATDPALKGTQDEYLCQPKHPLGTKKLNPYSDGDASDDFAMYIDTKSGE